MNVPALHDHWYMPRAQPPHSPGQTKYEHHRVALTRAVRISNLKTAGMGTRENTQQHTSKQLAFVPPTPQSLLPGISPVSVSHSAPARGPFASLRSVETDKTDTENPRNTNTRRPVLCLNGRKDTTSVPKA